MVELVSLVVASMVKNSVVGDGGDRRDGGAYGMRPGVTERRLCTHGYHDASSRALAQLWVQVRCTPAAKWSSASARGWSFGEGTARKVWAGKTS